MANAKEINISNYKKGTFSFDSIESPAKLIRALKATGEVIYIPHEDAYYNHRLTLEDCFKASDVQKVIDGMEFYGIIAFEDFYGCADNETGATVTETACYELLKEKLIDES